MSGVPCSTLSGVFALAAERPDLIYVPAANEGDAVAIAAGAWLAGAGGAALMQNSGLGNSVSPMTSLVHTFDIPMRLCIGWRGRPGHPDEPQHDLMGRITPQILELCGFEPKLLTALVARGSVVVAPRRIAVLADAKIEPGQSYPISTGKSRKSVIEDRREFGDRPLRRTILEALLTAAPPNSAIITTTGRASRELFEIEDRAEHFYQVGSMGCASSVGLGFALRNRASSIVVDGDGAALMRMGAMATIGAIGPAHLVHILIDNEEHETTGGQPTVSRTVDLSQVAAASGYATVSLCDSRSGFRTSLERIFGTAGPHFILIKIAPGTSPSLGRPTIEPRDVARRFRARFCSSTRKGPL